MRLLKYDSNGKISQTEFPHDKAPSYAILSHTWGKEEVTFKDVTDGTAENKLGYEKIRFCGEQASRDGLQYFWVDTCCIDKSSSAELQESINSMFRWYRDATVCYVYLADVSKTIPGHSPAPLSWETAFRRSRWFTRGWTLQELIAPASVEFFSRDGVHLGSKSSLERYICEITRVPAEALQASQDLSQFTVDERLAWMQGRETTREEDMAYSLLGIFNVHMPLIYSEGKDSALRRLKEEIDKALPWNIILKRTSPKIWLPSIIIAWGIGATMLGVVTNLSGFFATRFFLGLTGAGLFFGVVFYFSMRSGARLMSAKQPETPPQPSASIPFSRDPDFVHRRNILDEIDRQCSEPAGRVALVGLGGVGKSQLAIEFAHRIAEARNNVWVFWIHAGTQARVEEGFRMIADTVELAERRQPKADIPLLVQNWLANERNSRWIIVLDSADDREVFYSASESGSDRRPLASYLPQSRNGSIIVTTRDKDLAFRLTGNRKSMIEVGPMTLADAFTLLEKKLGSLSDARTVADDLVKALDCVPLAISQAAAYIQAREPRSSVEKYLAEFRESERKRTRLLEHDAGDLRRDGGASNAILTTWQLSFDYIQHQRPSAADLLSLMSFFDRQGIPESVLKSPKEAEATGRASDHGVAVNPGSNSDSGTDSGMDSDLNDDADSTDNGFECDVAMLRDYCLISANEEGDTFEMHGLVQLSTRKWLDVHGQQETFKQQYIERLTASFPTGQYENWTTCQKLFAHVQVALDYRPVEDKVEGWASLLHNGGWYAWLQGRYDTAERMVSKARKARAKKLGAVHPTTLASTSLFASVLRDRGRWEEAEKLFVQVIETRKNKLGADHPDTLTSMANLALTFWSQGRWEEAEKLGVQVMEIRKNKFGADHPSTLTSMAILASTFWSQGRWEEAEKLDVQVMETSKNRLGADHPDTLTSMANLASTYKSQGRWEEAEKLGVQVMEIRKNKFGADHPSTLTSIAILASTFWSQGRWEEAEKLEVQVMESRKGKLGADHPDTLTSIANLASTYKNQGRWEEAEKLEVQVMETSKNKLGADHPDTLTSISNLALTFWSQGRWEEAEKLGVQVMETRKNKLGADHPDTLTSMANLALTFWNQGRWEEAEKLGVQVMEIRKNKFGADHPSTLTSMAILASTFWSQGRYEDALALMKRCFQARQRVLGPQHPHTRSSLAAVEKWSSIDR